MQIRKIKTVKGYKSFIDFSWCSFFNAEDFHDEVNILYGENGSGKTSISNILKSVSQNKDFERHFPNETSIQVDATEHKYKNRSWDSNLDRGSILFFDKEFVDKNVHLGHDRGTQQGQQEQESGKIIIEFDSQAINLRSVRNKTREVRDEQEKRLKKFERDNKEDLDFKLDDDEEALYEKFKNRISDWKKELGGNKEDLDFKLNDDKEALCKKIKNKISDWKKELEGNKKTLDRKLDADRETQKKVQEIQSNVSEFDEDGFDYKIAISGKEDYQSLFDFDLKEQSKIKAEQSLIEKLKTHKEFFEGGFDVRKSHPKQCPFCQSKDQEESIKHILETYNQIYDDTYKKQRNRFFADRKKLLEELQDIREKVEEFSLRSVFLELKRLDEDYKIKGIYSVPEEKKLTKPKLPKLKEFSSKISNLQKPNKEKIDSLYDEVNSEVKKVQEFFDSVKKLVEEKNKIIKKYKADNTDQELQQRIQESEDELAKIEKQLDFINSKKIDKEKKRLIKEKEIEKESKILDDLREKHKKAKDEYKNYCSSGTFPNLLNKIQDYFKSFNFSFKLQLDTKRRDGSTKEIPFAFKVLDADGAERDFKEGLSEGERQVLSLCFFFAFLDIQQNKDEKVLVFDDPITSLDNSNLSCLVDLIAEEKENSQTFIFTHHRTFFKFLRKRFSKKCHEYNLVKNKKEFGGSFICKSTSDKFVKKLRNFESHLQSPPPNGFDMELEIVKYGQYLRYEVERFIKNDLLHWGVENNFTLAIKGVKKNKAISDDDLDKVSRIYSFCNWTTSHVDVGDDHGLDQLKEKMNEFIEILDAN